MQDDATSAPATRCSVSVRQGGKRVAFMELDPSTTLRECLQQLPSHVDAPALVDGAAELGPFLGERDVFCG